MKRAEIVSAVVMLLLAAVTVFATRGLPYWSDFAPGPGFAPIWVSALGALLAVALMLEALRRRDEEAADWPDGYGLIRVLLTLAGLWAILMTAPWLGLVGAIAAFVLFLLLVVLRRKIVPSLVAAGLTLALIYGVFVLWLGIAMPTGPLGV